MTPASAGLENTVRTVAGTEGSWGDVSGKRNGAIILSDRNYSVGNILRDVLQNGWIVCEGPARDSQKPHTHTHTHTHVSPFLPGDELQLQYTAGLSEF